MKVLNDELYHHGIKGMKWGVRRFQTKDGALTKAGQKRYNKEMDKLKSEKKRLLNEERTKKKMAKLDQMKSDVDKMKKGAKEETDTTEQKRERLLKSTDPKELYENRDLLTANELNERINRIDMEARLKSKIVEEHAKTGMERTNDMMKSATNTINNAANLYKSVDNAYSSVANSAIGKTLAKQLGIEPPKKEWNFDDFMKNINKKSNKEVQEASQRMANEEKLKNIHKQRAKQAEKNKPESDSGGKSEKKAETKSDNKSDRKENRTETYSGEVFGEGTSRYKPKDGPIYDADFEEVSNSRTAQAGQDYLNRLLLLEDKRGKR